MCLRRRGRLRNERRCEFPELVADPGPGPQWLTDDEIRALMVAGLRGLAGKKGATRLRACGGATT